jgi:acetoacetyl-CoA synthetase
MQSPTPHSAVLARNVMPGAQWFTGAQANYAQQVFRHVKAAHAAGFAAIICQDEAGHVTELPWPELRRQAASLALHLRAQGVQPGDRVAAYLPNCPEAMVAFLATVSLGARPAETRRPTRKSAPTGSRKRWMLCMFFCGQVCDARCGRVKAPR